MEPLHPPYVPQAISQPRQLNRWLDVNAQNGPLGRTQTYITLPAFSQAVSWRGYSEIAVAFNFEGPNNLSLRSNFTAPLAPNYVLCIMWEDSLRVTHRYALWRGVGEKFYFDCPLYTGQLIKKNFRLEVWSTNSTPAIQTTPINLFTSVLGNEDYRWGTDFKLVSNDTPTTVWGQNLVVPAIPNNVGAGNFLMHQFISTVNFAAPNWTDVGGLHTVSSANIIQQVFNIGFNNFTTVSTDGAHITGNTGDAFEENYIIALVYVDGSSGDLVNYSGSPIIALTPTTVTFGTDVALLNGVGKLYLIVANYVNKVGSVVDFKTQLQDNIGLTNSAPTVSNTLTLLNGGLSAGIVELVSYNTLTDFQGVYAYFFAKYGGFSLPFTFPNNNAPITN